jgi:hypothetical protein
MQVYDISVTFSRKIQVVNFEPAEATVSLKAQLKEGEDHNGLVAKLISDAKAGVRLALTGKISGETAESVTTIDSPAAVEIPVVEKRRGRPAGSTKKVDPPVSEVSEFEDEAPKPAASVKPVTAPAQDDEFSATEEDEFSDAEKAMTTKELQEQLSALVNSKAIDSGSVKAVLQKYGATRSAETKEGDRAKVLDEVRAIIAAKKK